jgi:predicted AlkP superfamily phosphohydrolase/phosphomutase
MARVAAKVLAIGLELGDGELIHRWAESGRLPTIAALLQRGRWCWLETTAEQLHISAWPSIYTGTAPGEHGVYFTFQPTPGLQGYQRFHTGLYGKPTFWQLLDRAGKRCSVFDPPYSHPEEGFRGSYVYDWGTWAHYLQPGSVPDGLLKRLNAACGPYPLGLEANDLGFTPLDPVDLGKKLVKSVQAKTDATCWLMAQSGWQLMFTVFGETHVAGHYCWSADLADDTAGAENTMFSIYAELDRAVGRLCEAAGPDALVMIISGDRVGPNFAGWHLLPDILMRLGYFGGAPANGGDSGERPAGARSFDPVKALRDLLPKDFRKSLARRLPTKFRDKLAQRVDTADIDWAQTRAFCLPTDLEGYIRVNLKGREPLGVVEPGAEYETLLDDLSAALAELRDPATDALLVHEVVRTDREFPGERRAYLPDLIVRWAADRPVTAASSARIGTVAKLSPDSRAGTHRGPGFLLASGLGVPAGTASSNAHILDFAPTVLAALGVDKPEHMVGRVLREFLPA